MLKNESLKGALIYYDGQHNDARMNLAIVLTAIRQGAKCANHVKVDKLLKDENGKVKGAHVKDMVSFPFFMYKPADTFAALWSRQKIDNSRYLVTVSSTTGLSPFH